MQRSNVVHTTNNGLAVSNESLDKEQETEPISNVLQDIPQIPLQPQEVLQGLAFKTMQERFAENLKRFHEVGRFDEGLARHLGIEFTMLKPGYVEATMPVDERTCRFCNPVNILNGGASLALAENAAGLGSLLLCKQGSHPCGIQVSANHLSMVKVGHVITAKSYLTHLGKTLHLWDTILFDERQRIVSSIHVTNMIISAKSEVTTEQHA